MPFSVYTGRQPARGWWSGVRARLAFRPVSVAYHQAKAAPESWFELLADSVTDVFWIYQPHAGGGRFLHVNPAYGREWHRSASALYADPAEWFADVHADDRAAVKSAFDQLGAGVGYTIEYRSRSPGGEERWIEERAHAMAGQPGQPLRISGVSQVVTARKQAEMALKLLARNKSEMLAMLAHELRNPLQPIRLAASLLARQRIDGAPAEKRAIAIIERQVNHLTRLVDDFLDLGRINHGKVRLRLGTVSLDEVMTAALEANAPLIEKKKLLLRFEPWTAGVQLVADEVRLTQVFSNLLHNAAKFSHEGGTVKLSVAESADNRVTVLVRDEGVGIAADMLGTVFELFTQADDTRVHAESGLGIGLTVVRSVVDLHGGSVDVHSDGIGRGCEFGVTLPRSAVTPSARPATAPGD